ncbi:MAG: hypothetical protein PHN57_06920 [Candidatus Omnitrophica bacterium]|nr:hypothetical protein [Candidatus Omnitrophota bacterium]
MCPLTLFYQVLIIGVVALLFYSYNKMNQTARRNFANLSVLLKSPETKGFFSGNSIQGYYKDRKVYLSYQMSDDNSNWLGPSMEPRAAVKQKFFIMNYPRVTENTILMNGKVWYTSRNLLNKFSLPVAWGNIRPLSTDDFLNILEELRRAVEIVEMKQGNNSSSAGF